MAVCHLVRLVAQLHELLRVVETDHQISTPPSITPMALRSRYHRSTGCSLTYPWPPSSCTPSRPIFMPLLGTQLTGQPDLARRVLAGGHPACGLVGQQAHRLQLDRDVGDHERDGLTVGDGLAERLAHLDVRRHVVEHGLPGADGQGAPGQSGQPHALGVPGAVAPSEQGSRPARPPGRARSLVKDAARTPMGGIGLDAQPGGACLNEEQRVSTPVSSRAPTTNSSASAPRGTRDLTPSRTKPSSVRCREVGGLERVEEDARFGQGKGGPPAASTPVNALSTSPAAASVPHSEMAVATDPGARAATAMPRSPFASASATRTPAVAVRSSDRPAERLGYAEDREGRRRCRPSARRRESRRRHRRRRPPGGPPRSPARSRRR